MFNSLRWQIIKQWWRDRQGQEDHSHLSQAPPLTRSEQWPLSVHSLLGEENYPVSSQLSHHEIIEGARDSIKTGEPAIEWADRTLLANRLYWMSFRAHDDSFLGVVIGRGTSPGKAASRVIDSLELASNRASIVAIPVEKEISCEPYLDRLLDEGAARKLAKVLDTTLVVG